MNEIMEEYGSMILGTFAAAAMIRVVVKLLFFGGVLGEVLVKLGNMAC